MDECTAMRPFAFALQQLQQSVNLHETSGVTEKFGFNLGNQISNMVPNPLREDLINILKNTLKWQVDLVNRVSHFYTFFELSLVLLTTQAHGL